MSGKTYILVHGAGHGSWCWQKVVPILEAGGHTAIPLDLPSSGNDIVELGKITLQDDVRTVTDTAGAVVGKVILVGHSSGGIAISQAAEHLGAEKIDKLVYLDAFLPRDGDSVFALADMLQNNNTEVPTADPPQLFIFSTDKTSCKWNPALVKHLFFHDCSPEDIVYAQDRLCWQSLATLATPVCLTEGVYGSLPKYYILCTEAKDLDKSSLSSHVRCEQVYTLPSSHSPFFSMPEKLADILAAI